MAAKRRPGLRVHAAGDLRPPVVQAAEEGRDRAAHHDVVEVGDDEVRVGDVDVDGDRGQEQAGEAAHGEEADEAEGVDHRGLEGDLAAVHGGGPVEDFDGGRHGHHVGQEREDEGGIGRDAGHEHVVAPDEEADDGDAGQRPDHGGVAEDAAAREAGDDLAHHAHRRQQHDVDGGVAVEPEQVLEEDRVAAARRLEDRHAQHPLDRDQQQHHGEHGRGQHHDDRGGVERPDEQRQAEPGHARRAQHVDGGDEVDRGGDGREAGDEDAGGGEGHVGVGE